MKKHNSILLYAFIFCLGLISIGCSGHEKFKVLSNDFLDLVPALVQIQDKSTGYAVGEVVLVLLPTLERQIRVTPGATEVVAIYNEGKRSWSIPSAGQQRQLTSFQYIFPSVTSEKIEQKLLLPSGPGSRNSIAVDEKNKASWVRAGYTGKFINIEVGFATVPETVRKVSYRVEPDGAAIILETGALLKIQKE